MRAIPRLSRLAASIGAASIAITAAASAQAAEYEWTFQASETAGENKWQEIVLLLVVHFVDFDVLPGSRNSLEFDRFN